ncbi:MAG: discoidin domain-containing protein [Methanothrix sp.]
MRFIVPAGIVIILAALGMLAVSGSCASEYPASGNVTGFGGLAIDYDIQGMKITEFQDWRRALTGYPTGSKVTITFKVSGPYSIEGSWSTDYAVSLNDKVIDQFRAPDQGGAPGWSYSPEPVEIDVTDEIKKNGFSLTATVGYARSSNSEGVMVTVVGTPLGDTSNIVASPQQAENHPPTVTLDFSPEYPTSRDTITLKADAEDPDGDSLTYTWFIDDIEISYMTGPSPEIKKQLDAGDYQYTVKVSDGREGTAEDTVHFSVMNGTELDVELSVSPDEPTDLDEIEIEAKVSGEYAEPIRYVWSKNNYVMEGETRNRIRLESGEKPGLHIIQVQVIDSEGRTGEAWMGLEILEAKTGIRGDVLEANLFDPIPDAKVSATSLANGVKKTVPVDSEGKYSIHLMPGHYRVSASAPGYLTESGVFGDDVKVLSPHDEPYPIDCYTTFDFRMVSALQANLALNKFARQSTTATDWGGNWNASRGVDGVKTGNIFEGGFHTDYEENPWWQVDMGARHSLSYALLYNRQDCCIERAKTLEVLLSNDGQSWQSVYKHDGSVFGGADGHPLRVELGCQKARFLRVQLRETNYLHLDEVEIFGCETNSEPESDH